MVHRQAEPSEIINIILQDYIDKIVAFAEAHRRKARCRGFVSRHCLPAASFIALAQRCQNIQRVVVGNRKEHLEKTFYRKNAK